MNIKYLQDHIRAKDFKPDLKKDYVLKLVEEVGELTVAVRKDVRTTEDNIKGSVEEEIWDVIYYALAIANCYDIDMEKWIPKKEELNNKKYGDS